MVRHVLHQSNGPSGLPDHGHAQLFALGPVGVGQRQPFRGGLHPGQRGPQLVRGVGQEAAEQRFGGHSLVFGAEPPPAVPGGDRPPGWRRQPAHLLASAADVRRTLDQVRTTLLVGGGLVLLLAAVALGPTIGRALRPLDAMTGAAGPRSGCRRSRRSPTPG